MRKEREEMSRPLAVVTGASSGIGAAFAERLARKGYDLLLVARRKERLEKLADELSQRHAVRVEALPADLAKDDELRVVEQRIQEARNLEFLVNSAGFGTRSLFHEADPEMQDRMHRLHVLATVRLTRAALPIFVARKKGFLVNVSSVAGFMQGPYNVSYCATKAWMISFTEGLHMEMRNVDADIRVQVLCPGFTISEFHQAMGMDRSFISQGWWMTAEEVVDASLAGFEKRRCIVVPGMRYKLIVLALKLIPRSILRAIAKRSPNVRGKGPVAQPADQ